MIPSDPMILLSFVNTQLRDYYSSLDIMCEALDADKNKIVEKLRAVDYEYDAGLNKFV